MRAAVNGLVAQAQFRPEPMTCGRAASADPKVWILPDRHGGINESGQPPPGSAGRSIMGIRKKPGAAEPVSPDPSQSAAIASRLNWLRAAVMGANDGIVSTAGMVVGVAGAAFSGGDRRGPFNGRG